MNEVCFIFGYGSLMSKSSFEKTLGRSLQDGEFNLALLHGYRRAWTLCHSILMYPKKKRELLPCEKKYITYLDVIPSSECGTCHVGEYMIGSIVKVTSKELAQFDLRERGYHRIDVSNHISLVNGGRVFLPCYIYIGNDESKIHHYPISECAILQEYQEIISSALSDLCRVVANNYWQSIERSSVDVVSAPKFFDPIE